MDRIGAQHMQCITRRVKIPWIYHAIVEHLYKLAFSTNTDESIYFDFSFPCLSQACVAYCFITIPSIEDIFMRLKLYLLSGQVAMANQAFSQGEQ